MRFEIRVAPAKFTRVLSPLSALVAFECDCFVYRGRRLVFSIKFGEVKNRVESNIIFLSTRIFFFNRGNVLQQAGSLIDNLGMDLGVREARAGGTVKNASGCGV